MHIAIEINDSQNSSQIIEKIIKGQFEAIPKFDTTTTFQVISNQYFNEYLKNEFRFGRSDLAQNENHSLISHSSGEQKKLFLNFVFAQKADVLILDRPFDFLDQQSVIAYSVILQNLSASTQIIQIVYRASERLPFIENTLNFRLSQHSSDAHQFAKIPDPPKYIEIQNNVLVAFKNVSVSYENRPILNNINWTVKSGEFWLLKGPNGSGKSTILSMILGENVKAYNQDISLFGHKKGSGESVWELKKNIGYFNPSMTQLFERHTTVIHMMVSGIFDSVGLYVIPTERQLRLAMEWLQLIDMQDFANKQFHKLSPGQQRLLMVARAMIKQPPLLLLDEPTTSLDHENVSKVCQLINHFAQTTNTAVVFVSHQLEPSLQPQHTFELLAKEDGSVGITN